ncbi:MAG: hypothetical protein ACFFBD_08430 [Candidatus Hodarchaeota archaeon]
MNWLNYLVPIENGNFQPIILLFLLFFLVVEVVLLVYVLKAYWLFKQNLESLGPMWNFLIAMLGVTLVPFGEIFPIICVVLTNNQYTIFENSENIFYVLGMIIALIFFRWYLQPTLIKRRRRWEDFFAHRFLNVAIIVGIGITLLMLLRFLLLGFMPSQFRIDTEPALTPIIIILGGIVMILVVFGSFQLYQEFKAVTSKLDRVRLLFYQGFFGAIALSIFSNLMFFIILISFLDYRIDIFTYLFSIPNVILPLVSLCSLYYAMFMPSWLQIRMKIMPKRLTSTH